MQAQADGHSAEHKAAAVQARVADLERDLARDLEPEGDEGRSDVNDTMGELLLLHMERG